MIPFKKNTNINQFYVIEKPTNEVKKLEAKTKSEAIIEYNKIAQKNPKKNYYLCNNAGNIIKNTLED